MKRFLCDQANGDVFSVRVEAPLAGQTRIGVHAHAGRLRALSLEDNRKVVGHYHYGLELPPLPELTPERERALAEWLARTIDGMLGTMCQLNPETCARLDAEHAARPVPT